MTTKRGEGPAVISSTGTSGDQAGAGHPQYTNPRHQDHPIRCRSCRVKRPAHEFAGVGCGCAGDADHFLACPNCGQIVYRFDRRPEAA